MKEELPQGWIDCTLGDIVKVQNGYAFPSKEFRQAGVPLIRQSNLSGNKVSLEKCVYLDPSWLEAKPDFVLSENDVLIGMSGSVGKLCIYDLDEPALQNQRTGKIVPRSTEFVDWRFVWEYLKTAEQQLLKKGKGMGVLNVSGADIESLPFRLAPLNEQRHIVAKLEKVLSRVDAAQARLATIPRILKRFRQSVLAAACSGRMTSDWRAQMAAEAQTNAGHILANGDIPSSWKMMSVEQIAKIGSGQSSAAIIEKCTLQGEVGWFKVSDMNSQGNEEFMRVSQNYLKRKDVEELRVKVFPKGSIIFPKRGGAIHTNKKRILIEPSCLDLNLMALIIDESLRDYFWVWFSTINLGSLSDGSNVPQINNTDILPLEVPLPPLAEQQEIVRRVEALFKTADTLEARYRAAKTHVDRLTQSILAKAFRGELVPQDPNDEPASLLIERLKQSALHSNYKRSRTTSCEARVEAGARRKD